VIDAVALLLTATVVTGNVAAVSPAGTVTFAGTVAAPLLLESATTAPPAGAALLNVTVPVDELPPTRLVGFNATLEITGAVIVSVAPFEPLYVPAIVAVELLLTAIVVTGNVAVVAPVGTVTLGGTVAAALLLESVTTTPPFGATPARVTVPVEELPPTTLAGSSVTEESTVADMESAVVRVVPAYSALIVAEVAEVTPVVLIANVAVV
jgi:hypothetical protein